MTRLASALLLAALAGCSSSPQRTDLVKPGAIVMPGSYATQAASPRLGSYQAIAHAEGQVVTKAIELAGMQGEWIGQARACKLPKSRIDIARAAAIVASSRGNPRALQDQVTATFAREEAAAARGKPDCAKAASRLEAIETVLSLR